MRFNRNKALSLILILVCSSTHSFWGEQKVRSMLYWLYSCRISQFFCSKIGMAPLSPLDIIKTMIKKKNDITFLKDLRPEQQNLIFKEQITREEADSRGNLFKKLYSKNNFFSLATFYVTINQFVTNQLEYLKDNAWTKKYGDNQPNDRSCSDSESRTDKSNVTLLKDSVMANLFNVNQPSFYTERRIIGKDDNTYLAGDLHGDPSPILDILETLEKNGQFDQKTGKLNAYTHLCFKGDLVDKGVNGSDCLLLAYSLKIINPDNVIIVRGNHEDPNSLTICHEKTPSSLNFGHEIYCKYYEPTSYPSCFLSFLFPPDQLKETISKSYAVMPVTAFILHPEPQQLRQNLLPSSEEEENDIATDNAINPRQYCGFVASHAGLDPALHPERLLTQELDTEPEKVLFDQYDTEKKLHSKNKKCSKALKNEIDEELNNYFWTHQHTIRSDASNHCDNKIKSLKIALKKANLINDEKAEVILKAEIQAIKKIKLDISNRTSMNKKMFEDLIEQQSNIKTSGYAEVTKDGVLQNVFNEKQYGFEPLKKPQFLGYYEEYFKNNIRSLCDVAACWQWKVPNKKKASFFNATATGQIEFNMSYQVFTALFKDWSKINKNIRFTLASQGHVQTAGLAFNKEYGFIQEKIIKTLGYGDSWDNKEIELSTQYHFDNLKSHTPFFTKSFDCIPANPCIAASCGSLYGCVQDKEEFQEYMKNKNDKIGPDYSYPGQSYNPIIFLFYNSTTNSMSANQSLVSHKNKEEL